MRASSNATRPLLWPALLAGFFGLLWLAQEMGWLPTRLPLGPLSVLIAALAMVRYAYEK